MLLVILALIAETPSGGCTAPTFQPPARYAVSPVQALLVRDLNGDGEPEIITSGNQIAQFESFSLLPNRGDGTFEAERKIQTRIGERIEDAADFDGDGYADLIVANYWQNGIAVYRSLGASQFAGAIPYDTATHGGPSRAIDYDRDGLLDLVSLSFGSANNVRVHLFRGRGDGTFDAKKTFDTTVPVGATPSMRFRDGKLEILVAAHGGQLGILRLESNGVFVSALDAGPGFDLNCLFADIDGDGIEDVVDTNDGGDDAATNPNEWVFVRLADNHGGFGTRVQLAHPRRMEYPTELRAGDFDGDGALDLIVGDFKSSILNLYRGHQSTEFDAPIAIDAGAPVNEIAAADVNRDGRLDLVTLNDDQTVSVLLNNGGNCAPGRRRAARH
ncbi:MAG: FG-GAP repeat domain-containing protein [Thermoanaerobaculia bacterium]